MASLAAVHQKGSDHAFRAHSTRPCRSVWGSCCSQRPAARKLPSGSGSAPNQNTSNGAVAVSDRTVNGASVLVNQAGATLYTNDQDKTGKLQCVSSDCTAIWAPLTVPAGAKPTAASGVTGTLATGKAPGRNEPGDSGRQAALHVLLRPR